MEVEQDGNSTPRLVNDRVTDCPMFTEARGAGVSESKDDKAAEGLSRQSLSIPIPASFLHGNDQGLPTPPDTPPADATTTFPVLDIPAQKDLAKELLFFHLLGASTDIVGFAPNGDLELSFASPG